MPHQCVRCNNFYKDGSEEILKGCSCGGKLFFYIKEEKLDQVQVAVENLSEEQKDQIEQDVRDIIGSDVAEEPVVLDLESIRIKQPGKYEIDLVHLFKGEPLVYKVGDGKYMIDVLRSFQELEKKK
jgi:uncharacterized protein